MVESIGVSPVLVQGERRNIKITFPADLKIAEILLSGM